jgi:cytochrome c oxidase subunit 1
LNFATKWDLFTSVVGRRFRPLSCVFESGMDINNSGTAFPGTPQNPFRRNSLASRLFRSDHKSIGLQHLWLAFFSVFVGTILSLAMRLELVWPGAHLPHLSAFGSTPDRYAALTLLHGSLMVFMVLTAAPQAGFGSYLLPLQIGARDLAFPRLSLLGFWATVVSLVGIIGAFFLQPREGMTLWIASVALFWLASLACTINFIVTVIDLRAKGMTLPRLPLTVWAWFINAILSMLIFSVLLAACSYLLADRMLGTHIFSIGYSLFRPTGSARWSEFSRQWQRLFWFFAQAQVYVALLPCFGLVTHLLSTFSRRPIWAQRAVILALCALGLVGFCFWGEHIFTAGLNPYSPLLFSFLASSLGFPASLVVMSWFGTLWNGKIHLTTAMLFALAFVSLFLSGGLSGLVLSRHDLTGAAASDEFVTGHFHLVMGVAATFGMLAALFFWFPKMFGRHLDERLGKIHFWLTFTGVYCVFMPMHWLGLMEHSAVPPANPAVALATSSLLRSLVTIAVLFTTAAQTFFVANFVRSLRRRAEPAQANPWHAPTLEWSLPSPPPLDNFGARELVVYRGAYEFGAPNDALPAGDEDFIPQHIAPSPQLPDRRTASPSFRGESTPPNPQPAGAG